MERRAREEGKGAAGAAYVPYEGYPYADPPWEGATIVENETNEQREQRRAAEAEQSELARQRANDAWEKQQEEKWAPKQGYTSYYSVGENGAGASGAGPSERTRNAA